MRFVNFFESPPQIGALPQQEKIYRKRFLLVPGSSFN
jgi:hypothetical protein